MSSWQRSILLFVKLFIIVRGHRPLFFFVIVPEALAQIVVVVFSFIAVVLVVICWGCVKLDRVVEHHRHFPSLLCTSRRSFSSVLQDDARENIFTSWHEILATG